MKPRQCPSKFFKKFYRIPEFFAFRSDIKVKSKTPKNLSRAKRSLSERREKQMSLILTAILGIPALYIVVMFLTAWL